MSLPQLHAARPFITDGGLETTLVYLEGVDLPDFAAFPLLDREDGRALLARYFDRYLDLAEDAGTGIVLDTPTWRANPDWGVRLGYDAANLAAANQRAVEFMASLGAGRPNVPSVVNGVIGPRGDGYVVGAAMSAEEAADYHSLQVRAFADGGAPMVSAITMTYAEEAIGIALAAAMVSLPVVISLTTETDGRLPSGQPLGEAIAEIDAATGSAPAYFMVNCAHPTHFVHVLDDAGGMDRIQGVRANASRLSHAELDTSTALDRGDVAELARLHARLGEVLDLKVVGGCCGTDDEHVRQAYVALTAGRSGSA